METKGRPPANGSVDWIAGRDLPAAGPETAGEWLAACRLAWGWQGLPAEELEEVGGRPPSGWGLESKGGLPIESPGDGESFCLKMFMFRLAIILQTDSNYPSAVAYLIHV